MDYVYTYMHDLDILPDEQGGDDQHRGRLTVNAALKKNDLKKVVE